MHVSQLAIRNLRCVRRLDLELSPGLNLIVGDNGAGKTSLLESLYLLSRGSSFRLTPGRKLIQDGETALYVRARLQDNPHARQIAIARDAEGTRGKMDQTEISRLSALMRAFPAAVIEPGSHRVLEDGPSNRRKLLDWVVFHVEHDFLESWRRYSRSLRQRNSALRTGDRRNAQAWDSSLVESADRIDAQRKRVAVDLGERVADLAGHLLGEALTISMSYRRGWSSGEALAVTLERSLATDMQRGFTQSGPHRAELVFSVNGRSARDVLSRGQQKLVVAAVVLAQLQLIQKRSEMSPVLLLDDFSSELGLRAQEQLWEILLDTPLQVLVTALEWPLRFTAADPARMFHVKHGEVMS